MMGIPDHLTCLLRNLYAGQESTVRTGHGTTDWFQIGKGGRQVGYTPLSQRQKPGSALLRSRREQAGAGVQVAAGEGTGRSRPGVSVSPCAHSACAWTSCTRSSASSAKAMARTTSRCVATCWPMPSLWPSSSSVSGRGHAGPPPLRLATGQGPTCFPWFCPPVC